MEDSVLPIDVITEILLRLRSDAAALFRCAATCRHWRAIVADISFLRHHWPENACQPSSLLGFVDMPHHDSQEPPFFYPISPGSVFGAHRRSLASFVSGAPDNILNNAVPLAARGGLLLVRLATTGDSLHLAVFDILTRTCDLLPPLECRVSRCQCAVLAREDRCSVDGPQQGRTTTPFTGYSTFFKVLAMVIGSNDQECHLYTFSSSETSWSEPRNCFDEVYRRHNIFIIQILTRASRVTVCRGVAYWLGSYLINILNPQYYFTFGVDIETGQISIAELPIPTAILSHYGLMLTLTIDGRLSLLHLEKEGLRLNTWTRGNDGTWLRTRVVELKPLDQQAWNPVYITMLSGEKSGSFFMADVYGRVHKTDPKTGAMEDVTKMFQGSLSTMAVPIEIDWPALFTSRLAKR